MKTNMTERDKKLLVGMLIGVIIVAIGYWGIIPQISAYNELETKIEKEEETQKLNKMKITNTPLIEMQADEYEQKLAAVKDDFYQILTSAEVDQMLTDIALKNKLNIYELKFSMPTKATGREAYVNSALYKQQQILKKEYKNALKKAEAAEKKAAKQTTTEADGTKSSASSSTSSSSSGTSSKSTAELMNAINGAEEGGYQPNTEIYAVPVTFTVGGEIGALENFLEEISNLEKTALLTGYTWGKYRTYVVRDANGNIVSSTASGTTPVTAEGEGVTAEQLEEDTTVRKSLTVRLEVYMCDTSAVNADKEETGETDTSSGDKTEDPAELLSE